MFRIVAQMRTEGISVLLVEQNAALALRLADDAYAMDGGRLTTLGRQGASVDTDGLRNIYLGGRAARVTQ